RPAWCGWTRSGDAAAQAQRAVLLADERLEPFDVVVALRLLEDGLRQLGVEAAHDVLPGAGELEERAAEEVEREVARRVDGVETDAVEVGLEREDVPLRLD